MSGKRAKSKNRKKVMNEGDLVADTELKMYKGGYYDQSRINLNDVPQRDFMGNEERPSDVLESIE